MSEEQPRRPILVASNVLITPRGEILMGLRSDCLLWETPGGKIEAESVVDGARREQREESGMELLGEPVTLGYTDGWSWSGAAGKKWYVCLMLRWTRWSGFPELREDSHLLWKWFKLDELPPPEMLTHGTRQFVQNILPAYLDSPRMFDDPEPEFTPEPDGGNAA